MDQVATIEGNVRQLAASLDARDDVGSDRAVAALDRSLLQTDTYQVLGDERLLSRCLQLLEQYYESDPHAGLGGLCQHLAVVRAVHDKFYAILDPSVDLDELLFVRLDRWPQLAEPIGCNFPDSVKTGLHEARQQTDSEQQLQDFFARYFDHLQTSGFGATVEAIRALVDAALEGYRRVHVDTVQALFATPAGGDVQGLKIRARSGGETGITCTNEINLDMKQAANRALACVRGLWPQTRRWDFTWDISRGDIPFAGNSIGLALTVGMLTQVMGFDVDGYTALTGHVEWDSGTVAPVTEIPAKLAAARGLGIRRVFVPRGNQAECTGVASLQVIPVATIAEALALLQSRPYSQASTDIERQAEIKIRQLEILLQDQGINKVSQQQRDALCKRVVFTDYQSNVNVDVYHGRNGVRRVVTPPQGNLTRLVEATCLKVFGTSAPEPAAGPAARPDNKRYTVGDPATQQRIQTYFAGREDSVSEIEQSCRYRYRITSGGQSVLVKLYTNGTLLVSGPAPLFTHIIETVNAVLGISASHTGEPRAPDDQNSGSAAPSLPRLINQIEAVKAVPLGNRWIGTDESGKGDYFGPLVAAAVLVDAETAARLMNIGVRDSKTLSDKQNAALAERILQICGTRAQVVVVPPSRYNTLYNQFQREGKNLNTLLAWAHTRALENLLNAYPQQLITVIVDKFADERYIQDKLLATARQTDLTLVQLPKAEANVAVAAASILARAHFIEWLGNASRNSGLTLPKGSSNPSILDVSRQIVAQRGRAGLADLAKLHFKTTAQVLSRVEGS